MKRLHFSSMVFLFAYILLDLLSKPLGIDWKYLELLLLILAFVFSFILGVAYIRKRNK